MPHFADRLPVENFVIYDDTRGLFGVHPAGRQWYVLSGEEGAEPRLCLSERERQYQELFRRFCRTIAIKERKIWSCREICCLSGSKNIWWNSDRKHEFVT